MKKWTLNSWRDYPVKHIPKYEDEKELSMVLKKVSSFPPLVFAGETRALKKSLGQVAEGKAFLLQGGDCAESFSEFSADNLRDTFRLILQMAAVLTYSASLPVVKIGRIAGQFAKPRSEDIEKRDNKILPSYRGDIINDIDFDIKSRTPDPRRMLEAYSQSSSSLNLLRAFSTGGFADLHQVQKWVLDFVEDSPQGDRYRDLAFRITEALDFMHACGITRDSVPEVKQVEFFTSHEALLLSYEEALTRVDSTTGEIYDCSAHMLWIGERTRELEGAHVEFIRGISNPVGVKIGPNTDIKYIKDIFTKLNPKNIPGRLTFITRLGKDNINDVLPKLIREVSKEGFKVVWSCDPMHANTFKSSNGYKTRSFENIISEVKSFFEIHSSEGTHAGGIHLEMTGKDVTECVGGAQEISEEQLSSRYHTQCDPRLNAHQGIELAFQLSDALKSARNKSMIK